VTIKYGGLGSREGRFGVPRGGWCAREPVWYHSAELKHHTADDSWRWHNVHGGELRYTPIDCGCQRCWDVMHDAMNEEVTP
jgi:hypothetical protein